jgi:HlyD family secretion protein
MRSDRTRINPWQWACLVLGAVAIAAIWGLSRKQDSVEVRVAPATYQDLERLVTTNGSVVPTSEFQARANFPGIVEKVYVELGDKVQAGQMLVSMKDPFASARIATANSALQAARVADQNIRSGGSQEERIGLEGDLKHAQLAQAEAAKGLAALERLQQQGAASAAEVDAAQQRLQAADATLQTA